MDQSLTETATMAETAVASSKEEKPQKKRKRKKSTVGMTVLVVIYFIYAATLLFPILWLLYNSLKDKIEFSTNPWAFPENPFLSLKNFGVIVFTFTVSQ